jgi:hypothetical protein
MDHQRNCSLLLKYGAIEALGEDSYRFVGLPTDRKQRLPYVDAVECAFGANVDFAQPVKLYANDKAGREWYSPSECA